MGWWKIDPTTGKPLKAGDAALGRLPNVATASGAAGDHDESDAHYLGDPVWDLAGSFVEEVRDVLGHSPAMAEADAEKFLTTGAVPKSVGLKPSVAKSLKTQVKHFWRSIDDLYREEVNRKSTDAERRWIRRFALDRLTRPPSRLQLEAKTKRGASVVLTLANEHDLIEVCLHKARGKEHTNIEVPVKVLAAAVDKPTFRLIGQARTARGPADRVIESSTDDERRRVKITGPSGKGLESYVAEFDFRRAFDTIRGVR